MGTQTQPCRDRGSPASSRQPELRYIPCFWTVSAAFSGVACAEGRSWSCCLSMDPKLRDLAVQLTPSINSAPKLKYCNAFQIILVGFFFFPCFICTICSQKVPPRTRAALGKHLSRSWPEEQPRPLLPMPKDGQSEGMRGINETESSSTFQRGFNKQVSEKMLQTTP